MTQWLAWAECIRCDRFANRDFYSAVVMKLAYQRQISVLSAV
jgi:hypothetical protein